MHRQAAGHLLLVDLLRLGPTSKKVRGSWDLDGNQSGLQNPKALCLATAGSQPPAPAL